MLQHQRGTTKGRQVEEGIVLPGFGEGSCRRTGWATSCRTFAQHQSGGAYWAWKPDLRGPFESRGLGELPVTPEFGASQPGCRGLHKNRRCWLHLLPCSSCTSSPSPFQSLPAFLALPSSLTLSPHKKVFQSHLYLSQLHLAAVAPDVLVRSTPHL